MIKIKSIRSFAAALLGVCLLTAAASAASDPTGTWNWSMSRNGQSRTTTLQLALAKDGALTGSVSGRNGDTQISDASFKDGAIAFSVKREFNGNSMVIKYTGKLDGDTIKGSTVSPGRDGGAERTADWTATRKAAAPADAAVPAPAAK